MKRCSCNAAVVILVVVLPIRPTRATAAAPSACSAQSRPMCAFWWHGVIAACVVAAAGCGRIGFDGSLDMLDGAGRDASVEGDAGNMDAGPGVDAGPARDAGPGDAARFDAGPSDAGHDAAAPDAFVRPDAGPFDAGALAPIGPGGQLAAGAQFSCALRSGQVFCWGRSDVGQLGSGTTSYAGCTGACSISPVAVSTISDATRITAGSRFACALRSGGQVVCWGANDRMQLGDGVATHASCTDMTSMSAVDCATAPVTVAGITNAIAVSAGREHACAVLSDGTVRCWGSSNDGRLGDGAPTHAGCGGLCAPSPVSVSGISSAIDVGAGGTHACALMADGSARCWGAGQLGQLGDGIASHGMCDTTDCSRTPVNVAVSAVELRVGGFHACVRGASGAVACWGSGLAGQLAHDASGATVACGSGAGICALSPIAPLDRAGIFGPVSRIGVSQLTTCFVLTTGETVCAGRNAFGQLGDGGFGHSACTSSGDCSFDLVRSSVARPLDVSSGASAEHFCAVTDSETRCWGAAESFQLGDGAAHVTCESLRPCSTTSVVVSGL